jgi:hypothetical protein
MPNVFGDWGLYDSLVLVVAVEKEAGVQGVIGAGEGGTAFHLIRMLLKSTFGGEAATIRKASFGGEEVAFCIEGWLGFRTSCLKAATGEVVKARREEAGEVGEAMVGEAHMGMMVGSW